MNATSPAPPAVGLSPESLMKYGRSRLASPRQQHRDTHPRALGPHFAVEARDEIRDGSSLRQRSVLVRRHAMRRREIERRYQAARHVAVRIHRRRDERPRSDDLAHRGGEIALRVGHPDHGHRAVDVEEDAVEGQRGMEAGQELLLDRLVELALDGSAGQGTRVHEWQPIDIAGQVFVSRKETGAARHREVGRAAAMWRERARLDVDPADRDAVAHHAGNNGSAEVWT